MRPEDFAALHAAASDPLIWEQHPEPERYREERFRVYFDEGMKSGGALVAIDASDGRVIGASRYHGLDPVRGEVEIGWTFLTRPFWGGRYNGEMKRLMLDHAFRFLDRVVFLIGEENYRSRKAVEKIGAVLEGTRIDGKGAERLVYVITRATYSGATG